MQDGWQLNEHIIQKFLSNLKTYRRYIFIWLCSELKSLGAKTKHGEAAFRANQTVWHLEHAAICLNSFP